MIKQRYEHFSKSLFVKNRRKLAEKMPQGSIAIFTSNNVISTNADGTLPFIQNSDLFYLTGIDQEETTLILFPDADEEKNKEVLFIRETNEHIAVWEGHKYTKEEAKEQSGINTIYWSHQLDAVLNPLVLDACKILLDFNEHLRAAPEIRTAQESLIEKIKNKYPLHYLERVAPIMHALRSVKEDEELKAMKKAISITKDAFDRVLNFVKPGVMEYEVLAEITHEFLRQGSRRHAYEPIIASGTDACILHYNDNSKKCAEGDLLLMDFGAEYGNYAADLSRTIPVSGAFSNRQKEVYNAVLEVQKEAVKMLVPGMRLAEYHKNVGKLMEEQLIKLGLLKTEDVIKQSPEKPLYKKYFPHGTSHLIGLDVHDVGHKNPEFVPGMVFTCEPGIYIREENIGIRLENDILITENGNIDLMSEIPIEVEEIEEVMK